MNDKNKTLKDYLKNSSFAITKLSAEAELKVVPAAVYGWLKGKSLAQEHIDKLESYLVANYGYKPEKEDNLIVLLDMQAKLQKMIEAESKILPLP